MRLEKLPITKKHILANARPFGAASTRETKLWNNVAKQTRLFPTKMDRYCHTRDLYGTLLWSLINKKARLPRSQRLALEHGKRREYVRHHTKSLLLTITWPSHETTNKVSFDPSHEQQRVTPKNNHCTVAIAQSSRRCTAT